MLVMVVMVCMMSTAMASKVVTGHSLMEVQYMVEEWAKAQGYEQYIERTDPRIDSY